MSGYKKLYVNGCSFTRGHTVAEVNAWPYLISKELGLELQNNSANANSLKTITYTSIHKLAECNPEETLVLIGLTWPTRFSLSFDNFLVNVTLGDLESDRIDFNRKLSDNRSSFPYSSDLEYYRVRAHYQQTPELAEKFEEVIEGKKQLVINQMTNDPSFTENLAREYVYDLLALQNFLTVNNFTYKFISFATPVQTYGLLEVSPLFHKLNLENIIEINKDQYGEDQSHPSAEGHQSIANIILNKL